jgi:ribosomal protein S18 acetylase RimI-like enzyme
LSSTRAKESGPPAAISSLTVRALVVRPIPLTQTRALRRDVLRPHQSLEELATHEPLGSVAFGAFEGDDLVAVGLIGRDGEEPDDWRIRGMATKPEARGQGAGSRVLQALVQHAADHGATRVWCNARTPALSLYQRAGFVVASEEFEPPDIGPHYRMELTIVPRG